MKKYWLLILWMFYEINASAQVLILRESLGSVSSTTSIQQHQLNTGFDNDMLDFDDGNSALNADIRNSSHSGGAYLQYNNESSSGGANVFFSSVGERGFAIHLINTQAFDSLQLYFAYRKESVSANAQFRIEYKTDAQPAWDSLSIENLPPANASTGWYYIGPLYLPATAQSSSLSIRWTSFNSAMRLDDIALAGKQTKTWIRSNTHALSFQSTEQNLLPNWQPLTLQIDGINNQDTLSILTHPPFLIYDDTLSSQEIRGWPFDNTPQQITFWVKTLDTLRGNYSDKLVFLSQDHDSLIISLSLKQAYPGEQISTWNCNDSMLNQAAPHVNISQFKQMNNNGNTQFISSSSSSELYLGASGGNNAAFSAKGAPFDTLNSTYLSWLVRPDSLKVTELLGLSFGMRSTSTGPKKWKLLHSSDGYSHELGSGDIENNSAWHWVNHDSIHLAFTEEVEFRLYFYDGDGGAPVNIANFRLDDLSMQLCTWNQKNTAQFTISQTGTFSNPAIWDFNFYDTFYRKANQLPDSANAVWIAETDTLHLDKNTRLAHTQLEGKLALNGFDLTLFQGITGPGKLIGHPKSNLKIQGQTDTLELGFSQYRLHSLELNTQGVVKLEDSLYIQSHLYLADGVLKSQGLLKLELGASNSPAQIIPRGNGVVQGKLCMKQIIPGSQSGWRAISSPWDTVSLGQLGNQLEIRLSGSNASQNLNAFYWNESNATWTAASQSNNSFRKQAINIYQATPNNQTFELCGLLDTLPQNQGKLSFNAGNPQEEGWHLIGNPYPWHLNWNALDLPSGMAGYYALWSVQDGNYIYWNGHTGLAGPLIPPMHGFWVKVNQTLTDDFIISRYQGDTGRVNHFYKNELTRQSIGIQIQGSGSLYRDRVELFLSENENFVEVRKLNGLKEAPEIWIEESGNRYAIQHANHADSIKVGVKIPSRGTYYFQLLPHSQADENWQFYDAQTKLYHPLNLGDSFAITLDPGDYTHRFYLIRKHLKQALTQAPHTDLIIQKGPYIICEAGSQSRLYLYSLDGKLLQTIEPENSNASTQYGPIHLTEGWYVLHCETHQGIVRKLLWWKGLK